MMVNVVSAGGTGGGPLPSPALAGQAWRPPAGGAPALQEPGLPPPLETPVFICRHRKLEESSSPGSGPLPSDLGAQSPHPLTPGVLTGAGQGLLLPHTAPRPSHPFPSHLLKPLGSDSEAVPSTLHPSLRPPGPLSLLTVPPGPGPSRGGAPVPQGSDRDNPEMPIFKPSRGGSYILSLPGTSPHPDLQFCSVPCWPAPLGPLP